MEQNCIINPKANLCQRANKQKKIERQVKWVEDLFQKKIKLTQRNYTPYIVQGNMQENLFTWKTQQNIS